ncbi:Poly-beta-hydroxybutyrate polymerase [Stieleria maiorica]|uniref:Poly-beta-hydroxybutyrate polymerase n=1 Tax=Stieleria maiorica TaxID=2795974 RepID=A0A5B9MPF7_9BACT|nr:alpha/beta fold hydrolase [Stieleria maiorica]QEG00768.1 Poly-beta-hydroxybutyrate polymerase [Stieleria maiorica]
MTTKESPQAVDAGMPSFTELCQNWHRAAENLDRFNRMLTTDAKIAQTPKEVVWTLNKAKLYHYVPVVPEQDRKPVPLFMVFAIMNRPHVLDLRPGHSFVEYMLRHGYELYLLDWGEPGPEDKNMCFDDYVLEYLPRAIRKFKSVSGAQEFSMLGWCLGALISTMYAALRPDDGLKNLLLLTAPLDFSDQEAGGFTRWSSNPAFNANTIVEKLGNVPGEMIDTGAKMLKPIENYFGSYSMLWDKIENPGTVEAWHAMNTWVRDIIPMAGGAYKQLINEFYKENKLMKGTMQLRGETVDLKKLKANLLNVIAEADHITPPCQSEAVMDAVGSEDKEVLRVRGGHIGIMAGRGAEKNTWPHIEAWLAERSGT